VLVGQESIDEQVTGDPGPQPSGHQAPTDPRWVRNTVQFLTGQTISLFGSSLVQYAILWHLTLETKSGMVLTAAMVFGFLPQAVVSVFGGVWADRHDRKRLIIVADALIAASTLVLALTFLAGIGQLWMILLAMAVRSALSGVQGPAVGAFLPQVVPTEQLMRVNGINASIGSAMMLLSPALAAALYASFGITAVLFVDVGTAVVGIVLLALLRVAPFVRDTDDVGYTEDLRAGLRYARGHPAVRWVLISFAVVFVLVVPPSYLTPLMIVRTFGEEVWMLTANEVAFSIGMILGGALLAAWGSGRDRRELLTGATIAMGVLTVLLGLSSILWVFLGLMLLVGVVVPAFSTTSATLLQQTVEPEMQGRMFGLLGIVMAVAMPLGMAAFGPLADVVSVEVLLIAGGALTVVAGVIIRAAAPPLGSSDPGAGGAGPPA
jgi:MFS transporter, DHA3 family, macrolide efflux protein